MLKLSSLKSKDNKQESLEDLSLMIESLNKSQAVIHFNTDGTIIKANSNFLNALGYELDEIVGEHHRMFVEEGYANSEEYQQFWETLANGEFQAASYKRITKSGKEIWIQASYNPIIDKNGVVKKIVKFATDITKETLLNAERKGQIDAIHKSQAVIEFEPNGTIITANENFLNAMGYNLEENKRQASQDVCRSRHSGEFRIHTILAIIKNR